MVQGRQEGGKFKLNRYSMNNLGFRLHHHQRKSQRLKRNPLNRLHQQKSQLKKKRSLTKKVSNWAFLIVGESAKHMHVISGEEEEEEEE